MSSDPNSGSWSDKLTIETPEQTVFDFPLAGVGSRAIALLLDTLIQFVSLIIIGLGLDWMKVFDSVLFSSVSVWAEAIWIFVAFCIYYGYYAFFESVWNGQTPGKRWTHLRVIHESGRPIAIPQAIARNIVRFIDQIPGIYAVGLVSALISRQNRRIGDIVAGTVVVHERPLEKGSAAWAEPASRIGLTGIQPSAEGNFFAASNPGNAGSATASPSGIRWGAAGLGGEDVRLLNSFLERRFNLDMQTRDKLARQIGERLAEKLKITFEQRRDAGQARYEDFLDALARERQN